LQYNKLSFLPYYWVMAQMLAQIVYLSSALVLPKYFLTPLSAQNFSLQWNTFFLELTCILCTGILLTIITMSDLLTALIKF